MEESGKLEVKKRQKGVELLLEDLAQLGVEKEIKERVS